MAKKDIKQADKYAETLHVGVEEDFSKYYSDEVYEAIHAWMKRQKFRVGETDVTYRVMNHWGEKKLLPEGVSVSDGVWRKFTPVEMAWLKVINRLRLFGFSLEKISTAKDYVMRWDENTYSYPLFEFHLFSAIFTGYDPYIVVFSDGSALLAHSVQIEAMKMINTGDDMLFISLKSVAREMKLPAPKPVGLEPLFGGERDLITQVRASENSEVLARKKKGKIKEIETVATYADESALSSVKKRFRDEGAYGEITSKIEGGEKQSFQVKRKRKIA